MKKLIAAVLVAGALFWAKKRYLDGPAVLPSPATSPAAPAAPAERNAVDIVRSLTHGDNGTPESKAKVRVTELMAAWKEGGTSLNDAAQAAACLWSRGVKFIPDANEIKDAADGFEGWRREQNLVTEIASYSVGEVVARGSEPGRGGEYSVVEVTINGLVHRIGVPDKANPLFWAK